MYSKKTSNYKCLKDTSGTEADVFEGTDFEFYGMPVDTTIYMEGKDHAVKHPDP